MRLAVAVWTNAMIRDQGLFITFPFFLTVCYSVILLVIARIEQSSAFSPPLSSLSITTTTSPTTTTTHLSAVVPLLSSITDENEKEKKKINHDGPHPCLSRRDVFELSTVISFALPVTLGAMAVHPTRAFAAAAESAAGTDTETNANSYKILRQMRSIPTFCIVTNEGIPFMVLDKDQTTTTKNQHNQQQTASGYFFLSYQTASGNLRSARQKEQQEGQMSNVCANAKIIIVPLGVALQLSLSKNQQREAVNYNMNNNDDDSSSDGIVKGPPLLLSTHHDIIVSTEGMEDANEVDNRVVEVDTRGTNNNNTPNEKDNTNNINTNTNANTASSWALKERVPLFYMEGLKLADGKEPRYFNELDLWQEWDRQHPPALPVLKPGETKIVMDAMARQQSKIIKQQRPPTKLVELLELYGTALNLDDSNSNSNNSNTNSNNKAALDRVANLTLMPVAETVQVGKELVKTSIPPNYNFKQMYLMGGPPSTTTTTTTTTSSTNNNN